MNIIFSATKTENLFSVFLFLIIINKKTTLYFSTEKSDVIISDLSIQ